MTSENKTASVLELVSSRICHDLISPIGAINNGIEFMKEMGEDAGEEATDLIAHSASQTAAKLQAYRLAYGAGGNNPDLKPQDVQKAISELVSAEGKISQMWDPFAPLGADPLPPSFCKVLMGTFMIAIECLPRGGSISAKAGSKDGSGQTLVTAEGESATLRENVAKALARDIETDNLDPRLVHPYAISLIASNYGYSIEVESEEDGKVVFAINFPEADTKKDDDAPMSEDSQDE
jgi:histidine phosphotransferase ChpT